MSVRAQIEGMVSEAMTICFIEEAISPISSLFRMIYFNIPAEMLYIRMQRELWSALGEI